MLLSFIPFIPCQKKLEDKTASLGTLRGRGPHGRGAIAGWDWKGRKPALVVRELSKTPNYCVS